MFQTGFSLNLMQSFLDTNNSNEGTNKSEKDGQSYASSECSDTVDTVIYCPKSNQISLEAKQIIQKLSSQQSTSTSTSPLPLQKYEEIQHHQQEQSLKINKIALTSQGMIKLLLKLLLLFIYIYIYI